MTKFKADIIAESMYAQHDVDKNKYHMKNVSDLSIEDEEVVVEGRGTHRKSTAGLNIHYKWKDDSTSWKNPIQIAKERG